jgi:hypothetical protein
MDIDKLKDNALISIRLGVQDFLLSQTSAEKGGDPNRALSSVRNFFAGLLLLFKYRIATTATDPQATKLSIFNVSEIKPISDGKGGIIWQPVTNNTTINFITIKKRLDALGIVVDWKTVEKINKERNELEHLHPPNTVGEVAAFVAALFPVLRDFITNELNEIPAILLGDAWTTMLKHHTFFSATLEGCKKSWGTIEIPSNMKITLEDIGCEDCGSPLIRPSDKDNKGLNIEDAEHLYVCDACNHKGNTELLLIEQLSQLKNSYEYDPYDSEESSIELCDRCGRETFVVSEGKCFWCNYKIEYIQCKLCKGEQNPGNQNTDGLCEYHDYELSKDE